MFPVQTNSTLRRTGSGAAAVSGTARGNARPGCRAETRRPAPARSRPGRGGNRCRVRRSCCAARSPGRPRAAGEGGRRPGSAAGGPRPSALGPAGRRRPAPASAATARARPAAAPPRGREDSMRSRFQRTQPAIHQPGLMDAERCPATAGRASGEASWATASTGAALPARRATDLARWADVSSVPGDEPHSRAEARHGVRAREVQAGDRRTRLPQVNHGAIPPLHQVRLDFS